MEDEEGEEADGDSKNRCTSSPEAISCLQTRFLICLGNALFSCLFLKWPRVTNSTGCEFWVSIVRRRRSCLEVHSLLRTCPINYSTLSSYKDLQVRGDAIPAVHWWLCCLIMHSINIHIIKLCGTCHSLELKRLLLLCCCPSNNNIFIYFIRCRTTTLSLQLLRLLLFWSQLHFVYWVNLKWWSVLMRCPISIIFLL